MGLYDWVRQGLPADDPTSLHIPLKPLGNTGETVTRLGLGGQGYLQYGKSGGKAIGIIRRALDLGIKYFDTAPGYGESQARLGWALRGLPEAEVFLATKTHERSYDGSMRLLEESMRLLGRRVNLWQLHNLQWKDRDFKTLEKGVVLAMYKAKQQGLVDHIGVTGHSDPVLLREFINYFPHFDTCLFALNMADIHGPSFKHVLLPKLVDKGMGAIAMKVMARGPMLEKLPVAIDAAAHLALRYVLSHDIDCAIVGVDNEDQLVNLVNWTQGFSPLNTEELERLEAETAQARVEGNWFKICFEGTDIPERFNRKGPVDYPTAKAGGLHLEDASGLIDGSPPCRSTAK